MHDTLTVAVCYGGASPEHSISCISAASIMRHLSGCHIVPIGISQRGGWYLGDGDLSALDQQGSTLPCVKEDPSRAVALSFDPDRRGALISMAAETMGEELATIDLLLPVLHGPNGEDGTIQGLCELAGVPYVGCGVLASAQSMDKEFTKRVLGEAGLPIGKQVILRPGENTLSPEDKDALGLPVFVKPARGGSSIGITKVSQWDGLDAAIAEARTCDDKVIIEAAIYGREIECGVLEWPDGRISASEVAEICMPGSSSAQEDEEEDGFYDFDTKYVKSVVTTEVPARISTEDSDLLRELACRAFRAIDGKGLVRVDFFLTDEGPVINEINTFPGFTSISMYPQMWAATGVDYDTLISTLIETEYARHSAREQ